MSQDRNDDLKPPEMRPAVERPRSAAKPSFDASQQPAAYYSPPPGAAPPAPAAQSGWRLVGLAVLAAAVVAVGTWCALRPAVPPAPVPAVAAAARSEKTFSVSKVDADLKATEYLKNLLAGKSGQTPAGSSAADVLRAVNAPALIALAKTSPATAADIQSGRCVLYRLILLDFLAEDGDHAELFVDGVGHGDVYLKNAGKEFLIPLIPGKPSQMKLLATGDGGGGVTVGFVSSLGEARTRLLNAGQSEEWVVTVQ
jgi:hypothetical protein